MEVTDSAPSMRQESNTFTSNNGTAVGTAFTSQTIVHIRWGWLAFLASQLLFTFVVLVYTISLTRFSRVQVLKGSSLATMSALNVVARGRLGTMENLDALKNRATDVKVKLERGNSGRVAWLTMSAE